MSPILRIATSFGYDSETKVLLSSSSAPRKKKTKASSVETAPHDIEVHLSQGKQESLFLGVLLGRTATTIVPKGFSVRTDTIQFPSLIASG